MTSDFGVIVGCCPGDWVTAKGACASVRQFMGDVPICVLVDGSLGHDPTGKMSNIRVLERGGIHDERLRTYSFGWGLTKMVTFWESPFSTFLFMDADACLWGDLRHHVTSGSEALVVGGAPDARYTPEQINNWWFDPSRLASHFPEFRWQDRPYFNTGVFFAKRGMFSLDKYVDLLELGRNDPGLFKCGEQGMLNVMAFSAVDDGSIMLEFRPLQFLMPNNARETAEHLFAVPPPPKVDAPVMLHWCGPLKPKLAARGQTYVEPMTHFRRRFVALSHGIDAQWLQTLLLYAEELPERCEFLGMHIARRWQGLLRRVMGRRGDGGSAMDMRERIKRILFTLPDLFVALKPLVALARTGPSRLAPAECIRCFKRIEQVEQGRVAALLEGLDTQARVDFIQIGSNDGKHDDPIYRFVSGSERWHGILVEPVKYLFERLKSTYASQNRLLFEQVAISSSRASLEFHYVDERARSELPDLPFWYDQLGGMNRQHIVRHLGGRIEPYIVSESVPAITLEDLLSKHGVQSLDLLHIDTEGHDYVIFRQLDLQRIRPKVVIIEFKHLGYWTCYRLVRRLLRYYDAVYATDNDLVAVSGGAVGCEL